MDRQTKSGEGTLDICTYMNCQPIMDNAYIMEIGWNSEFRWGGRGSFGSPLRLMELKD